MTGSVTSSRVKISRTRRRDNSAGSLKPVQPSGHRRDDRHLVAGADLGVEAAGEADVLVVQVDVDKLAEIAGGVEEPLPEAGEARVELLDRGAQVAGLDLDRGLPLGEVAERTRNSNGCHA